MSLSHTANDCRMRLLNATHRVVRAVTGGRVGGDSLMGMRVVELHVIGRTSGLLRSTLLTTPVIEDGRIVLVASKGGDDRDPEWLRNLVATPAVELTIGGTTSPYRARVADAAERAALWPDIVAAYPGYGDYQRKTEREIPVVICEAV